MYANKRCTHLFRGLANIFASHLDLSPGHFTGMYGIYIHLESCFINILLCSILNNRKSTFYIGMQLATINGIKR